MLSPIPFFKLARSVMSIRFVVSVFTCNHVVSEKDELQGWARRGADGEVVLEASESAPRKIEPGWMPTKALAPEELLNSKRPTSTVVEDVSWSKQLGQLEFPSSFSGEISTDLATPETLAYYGVKFANREEGWTKVHMEHKQTDFTYNENYLDNYVLVDMEKGGAGGATLERHNFCHTDTPYEAPGKSGVFVIGKFLDAAETKIELTGFVIPQGETLWVLPGVIHTNNYLKGTWNTMLNLEEDIETVKLMREGESIIFTFR